MNPDGTNQMAYYGSNSYLPNSFFYARAIPHHVRKVVGIIISHHGVRRSGRLVVIDPAVGRQEAQGVVHEIPPAERKIEPIIRDKLVDGVWPQFLMPWPLSEKYFLVSCEPVPESPWGSTWPTSSAIWFSSKKSLATRFRSQYRLLLGHDDP
jgi:hypothetical protein